MERPKLSSMQSVLVHRVHENLDELVDLVLDLVELVLVEGRFDENLVATSLILKAKQKKKHSGFDHLDHLETIEPNASESRA